MTSLFGKPPLRSTHHPGVRCTWRQVLGEKAGMGVLWIEFIGEVEAELCPVPRKYHRELMMKPADEALELANNLVRMYQ